MIEHAGRLASALSALRPEAPAVKLYKLTPDGRSWLLYAPKFWPASATELDSLWRERPIEATKGLIMGREVAFPRRTRAYGHDYQYTGQTQLALPFRDAHTLVQTASSALGSLGRLNSALVNWYDASEGEYMGAHSDDERALVRHAPIISLSWASPGHYRRFRFTVRKGCRDAVLPAWQSAPGVLELRNGCLLVMGGDCQRTHKHELMKPTKALGESTGKRINLTLRAFAVEPETATSSASSVVRKRPRESHVSEVIPAGTNHGPVRPESGPRPAHRTLDASGSAPVQSSSYFEDDGFDEEALVRACL